MAPADGGRARPASQRLRSTTGRDPAARPGAGSTRLGPVLALLGVSLLAGGVGAGVRALRRVRQLRDAGAEVAPLDHRLELTGAGPARRLVVLGDSAAAGHGLPGPEAGLARRIGRALHVQDGRATQVASAARDGATTADVLTEQLAAARGADLVVVGVGVNDAVRGRRAAVAAAELRQVLTTVAADAEAVVLLSCPDLSVAPALPAVLRPLVGVRCRAVARAQQRVARELQIPVVAVGRAELVPEVFGPDGFHPGVVGHERLAGEVLLRLGVPTGR